MQIEESEERQEEELGQQAQRSQQQQQTQQGPQRPYSSKHKLNAYGGLISLLPDTLVPPEAKSHLWNARRESLLAGRSLLEAMMHIGRRRSRRKKH